MLILKIKMAGCVPCFIIPLLLFIFHRYIQPIILKFWNPWEKNAVKKDDEKKDCSFSCDCSWNKNKEVKSSEENGSLPQAGGAEVALEELELVQRLMCQLEDG
ncbi:hypothetical protein NQ317_005270 [Molorchus minor]|uniref:Uncharacterized protein n=1 Tax=Molorchus minor TaxID=1323400 RepID=A0ABQ9JX76_9CUCU|nr:hypothetical protein NQ317_005270 [Molorchus minor]